MKELENDLGKLRAGHARLSDAILQLAQKMEVNNQLTTDISELLNTVRGGFKALAWLFSAVVKLGRGLVLLGKFIALPFALIYVLVYMMLHGGQVPAFWLPLIKLLFG